MSQCLLHVGLHKTGTTTLQRDLKAACFEFNHLKPWRWENTKVVNNTLDIAPRREFDFFSWEQLSFMDREEASDLIRRLRLAYTKVIVILVFRDPSSLYASHKNQSIKHLSALHPPGGVFERELYGISPAIKNVPTNCWYLDEQHHLQKWSGCHELRVLHFDDIVGKSYTKNFIEKSESSDFFASLVTPVPTGSSRQSNPSIDHARFIVASHIFEKNKNGSLSDEKLTSFMYLLLKGGLRASLPLPPKAVGEDFVANDSGLSVLNFTLDLLEEIYQLRRKIDSGTTEHDIKGIIKEAISLIKGNSAVKAQAKIQESLQRFPNQIDLLTVATDAYRACGDPEKSLEYAELLIKHHPENWEGYARAAQDKLSLSRFDDKKDTQALDLISPPPPDSRWHTFWNSIRADTSTSTTKRTQWISSFSLDRKRHSVSSIEGINQWQPFQYWSQGKPPNDVSRVTEEWNLLFDSIGMPSVQVFNRATAMDYIEDHCSELSVPFSTAFHYAVEADVFRVAFAQKNNCIWLDSDLYPTFHTKDLITDLLAAPRTTLLFRWHKPWITNAFFLTPSSSAFFRLILDKTKDCDFRLLDKNKKTIFNTFGPGKYNRVLESMANDERDQPGDGLGKSTNRDPQGLEFVNEYNFANMKPPFRLAYKTTNDAWMNFMNKSS